MSSLTPQPNSLSFPFRPSALGFLLVFLSVVSLSSVSTQPPSPPPPLLHFHTAVLAQLSMTFGASYSLSSLSLSLSLPRPPFPLHFLPWCGLGRVLFICNPRRFCNSFFSPLPQISSSTFLCGSHFRGNGLLIWEIGRVFQGFLQRLSFMTLSDFVINCCAYISWFTFMAGLRIFNP